MLYTEKMWTFILYYEKGKIKDQRFVNKVIVGNSLKHTVVTLETCVQFLWQKINDKEKILTPQEGNEKAIQVCKYQKPIQPRE